MGFPEDAGLDTDISLQAEYKEYIYIIKGLQTRHGIALDGKRPIKGKDGIVDQWIIGVAKNEQDILPICVGHPFICFTTIVYAVRQPFGVINANPTPEQEMYFRVVKRPDCWSSMQHNPNDCSFEKIEGMGF